jgi:hypothetical protein
MTVQRTRMVRLVTVSRVFHARVLAARLGAEGIVTELRGNVDGPYPVGDVHVYVGEEDLGTARELLLADEVEDALGGGGDDVDDRTPRELWLVLAAILAIAAMTFVRLLAAR